MQKYLSTINLDPRRDPDSKESFRSELRRKICYYIFSVKYFRWKVLAITLSAVVGVCFIAAVVLFICRRRLVNGIFSVGYKKHADL